MVSNSRPGSAPKWNFDDPNQQNLSLGIRRSSERSAAAAYDGRTTHTNTLTTHVWPKSRMLFAIVSKMSKEGDINETQCGVLKDLILENDNRIMTCLANYESDGQRDRLYLSMKQIANETVLGMNS